MNNEHMDRMHRRRKSSFVPWLVLFLMCLLFSGIFTARAETFRMDDRSGAQILRENDLAEEETVPESEKPDSEISPEIRLSQLPDSVSKEQDSLASLNQLMTEALSGMTEITENIFSPAALSGILPETKNILNTTMVDVVKLLLEVWSDLREQLKNYLTGNAQAMEKPVYDPQASCSIFIYMCGSNLESKHGLAGQNIDELLEADIPPKTNVVIETGGTSMWWSHGISKDSLQRYVVKDRELVLVDELENSNMGSPATLADFLRWGTENYPSERSVLVFWDHGSISADGVCYDENYNFDCLNQKELEEALGAAMLPRRFDLVALDTCYTGSLEMAALFSDYAYYMTASQVVVPGGGLDYKVLAEAFAGNDDEDFGILLCDSFMEKCRKDGHGANAQLALFDLSQVDHLVNLMEMTSVNLSIHESLIGNTFRFFSAARGARILDTTANINVIDFGRFMKNLTTDKKLASSIDSILRYAQAMVHYQVQGEQADCTGISVFYPFRYSKMQLDQYQETCPAKYYSRYLKKIYDDLPQETIQFMDPGSIDADGNFSITLDAISRPYLRGITCRIWRENAKAPGGYTLVEEREIGTYDNYYAREFADLTAKSQYLGEGVSLDGHLLTLKVVPGGGLSVYSSPVNVNGEDTLFRFACLKVGGSDQVVAAALGDGLDENGLPNRTAHVLKPGDRVQAYAAFDPEGKYLVKQEAFIIEEDGGVLSMMPLPQGKYRYRFFVTDIIGNVYKSDYGIYDITGEGDERSVTAKEMIQEEQ